MDRRHGPGTDGVDLRSGAADNARLGSTVLLLLLLTLAVLAPAITMGFMLLSTP